MVHFSTLVSSATMLLSALVNAAAIPEGACPPPSKQAKAVYLQTNKSPNHIAAISVDESGTLRSSTLIATGGNGGNVLKNGAPATPDPLSSQDSVKVFNNFLFTVNAGSNSISVFAIPESDPTDLRLLHTTPTPGDFPNSIAVKRNKICVGHAGANPGVSCADWSSGLIGPFNTLRPLPYTQMSPPNSSLNLLTDTFFSADGSAVFATVKGNGSNDGWLAKWSVEGGGDAEFVSPTGTAGLFGADVIPNTSKVFIADTSFGGVVIDLNKPQIPLEKTTVAGEKAICWARVDPSTNSGYLLDGGLNRLVRVDLSSGAIVNIFNSTNGNGGMLDGSIVGNRLYALAPSSTGVAHVAVFGLDDDISDVQSFAVPDTDANVQGMAVFA